MPQTTRRGVAPLNLQPRWPEGYLTVLREAGAQEKNIPHCVAWVRRFFAKHPGRRRRDLGRTEIEAFLAETAQRPGVSNWQVQQARDAIELYYEQFRGIVLRERPDLIHQKSPSPPPSTPTANSVVESHSTNNVQKSYIAGRGNDKGKNHSFVKAPGTAVTPPASTHMGRRGHCFFVVQKSQHRNNAPVSHKKVLDIRGKMEVAPFRFPFFPFWFIR